MWVVSTVAAGCALLRAVHTGISNPMGAHQTVALFHFHFEFNTFLGFGKLRSPGDYCTLVVAIMCFLKAAVVLKQSQILFRASIQSVCVCVGT